MKFCCVFLQIFCEDWRTDYKNIFYAELKGRDKQLIKEGVKQ